VEISVRGYNQLIEGNLPNEDDLNNYTHAPVITGFDCETETFKIRNSWGYREEDRISADLLFSPGVLKDAHTLIGTDQATKTQCEKELPSKPVAERSWDEDEILKADFLRMSSDLQSKRNELSQLENTLEDIYRQERELARPTRSDNGKLVYWEENLQTRERMYLLRRQGHEGRIQLKNLEKEIRELNRRIAILSRRVIF